MTSTRLTSACARPSRTGCDSRTRWIPLWTNWRRALVLVHDPSVSSARILLSPPDVGDLEQEYVLRAMKSGWVAPAGPDLTAFETEVADRVGVSHAVGLSSGTAALH